MSSGLGHQKKVSLLELESGMLVGYHVGAENWNWVLRKNKWSKLLNHLFIHILLY